ncbi:hypothetical protein ACROYT_G001040 [Oculina patagonica]
MPSKRFTLLFTSLLLTAVVVLYIISSKTENKASKILETPAWKGNDRIHSNNFTSTSRQKLENEETSSVFAEKLFKLYDGVETFVMFIGYPRSRHSLVAAILDAHPEIIITDQYDVITHLRKYQSRTQKNMRKYRLFFGIHQLAREEAMFGNHASPGHQLENKHGYYYNVPGSWQGGYKERIKVIGDKRGGATAMAVDRLGSMRILEEIEEAVQVPIKFIHVTRNPFDNIATMMLRATDSRDVVREGAKIDNKENLDAEIKRYFQMAASSQSVRESYGDSVLDIPGHETVLRPKQTLQRLCDHLRVTCSEDYIEKCSKILFGTPSVTRHTVVWTEEQKERVTKIIQNYPFLKEYSFDKYPS